jgi:hypothetical protein
MAISVTHATQSTVQDEQVPGEIGPDEWNAGHTVTGAVAAPASTTDKAVARYSGTAGQLQNNSQVTIDDTGVMTINLNSGTPQTPTAQTVLHLAQANASNTRFLIDAYGGAPLFTCRRANTSAASPSALATNDQLFNLSGLGWQSGGAYSGSGRALVQGFAAEAWTSTNQGAFLQFSATPTGSTTATSTMQLAANGDLQLTANTVITSARHPQLRSYTVATLPSAATAGQWIYVSDETGGATPAFSDATNWRRVSDRAVVA